MDVPVARIERVDRLPGGRTHMTMERHGEIRFLVLSSEITQQAADGLTQLMQHEIDTGTWRQCWPGESSPPHSDAS